MMRLHTRSEVGVFSRVAWQLHTRQPSPPFAPNYVIYYSFNCGRRKGPRRSAEVFGKNCRQHVSHASNILVSSVLYREIFYGFHINELGEIVFLFVDKVNLLPPIVFNLV